MKLLLITALAFVSTTRLGAAESGPDRPERFGENVQFRGSLDNSRLRFEREKVGRVAFLGGSITEMEGYRPMVSAALKRRFPSTDFTFVNAGISSTTSITGAFRLERDVLAGGPVDLLFVEFAVNDDQDGHYSRAECIRGMEGVIRRARRANPAIDIVITFFVNEGMLKLFAAGETPVSIAAHTTVAERYGISTNYVAREVSAQITAGTLTWKIYGGTHPAKPGNALAAEMVEEIFNRAWRLPVSSVRRDHPLPKQLVDPLSYAAGRFIAVDTVNDLHGWKIEVPEWEQIAGAKRGRFTSLRTLNATEAGAEARFSFEGRAIGAFLLAGPDAGVVSVSIDGGPVKEHDLYHNYSRSLHYPRTVMFADDLAPGRHTVSIRVMPTTRSAGHAVRIMELVAN